MEDPYTDRLGLRTLFELGLKDIDWNSSVGECQLNKYGIDYKTALKVAGGVPDPERKEFFFELVQQRVLEYLAGDKCADPLRNFIKPEPHKKSKVDSERWRLISAVSAVDAMVDRMLYMRLSHQAKIGFLSTPFMIGWSPFANGIPVLHAKVGQGPYLNIDKSAFDWTVPAWLVEELHDLIASLVVDAPDSWRKLHAARFAALFDRPVFQTSDGGRFRQQHVGVMKSGCYLTILCNSMAQILIHRLIELVNQADYPLPAAIGDDTSQTDFPRRDDYLVIFSKLGFSLKVDVSDKIEFAGLIAGPTYTFEPAYCSKNMFGLAHQWGEDLESTLVSLQIWYGHDEETKSELRRIAKENGMLGALVGAGKLWEVLRTP